MSTVVVLYSSYMFKCAVGQSLRLGVADCMLPKYLELARCLCADERKRRCRVEKMLSGNCDY